MAKTHESMFDLDISKLLGEFKVPGMDMEAMVASQKKNIEALTAANKLAYEGMQAVAKRQAEILRQTLEEAAAVTKQMTASASPQDAAAKQTDITKDMVERNLSNLRELSEMVARSNSDAVELLNKRFVQGLDEFKELVLKPKK